MLADDRIRALNSDAPHNVIMEGRSRMSISGVEDVESFDDMSVSLFTTRGLMTVHGSGLHIERLSLETGELNIEGNIDGMQYTDETPQGSFWSRLFK